MLFAAELPEFRKLLPIYLQEEMLTFSNAKKTQKSTEKAIKQEAKRKTKGDDGTSAEAERHEKSYREVVVGQEQFQSYQKLQQNIDKDILIERQQRGTKRKKKMK